MIDIDDRIDYTDFYESDRSSVISNLWYNANNKDMYVGLTRGAIYGYEDVPADVFRAFVDQEKLGGSLGAYWNEWIKPYMKGFGEVDEDVVFVAASQPFTADEQAKLDAIINAGEPELVAQAPAEPEAVRQEELVTEWHNEVTRIPITEDYLKVNAPIEVAPAAPAQIRNEYLITFEYDEEYNAYEAQFTVFSDNVDNALIAFGKATDALGYRAVSIKTVTLYFNQ